MSFSHAVSTNNYGPAKFIVATSAANGTHTTLASALAAASSGDTVFLRDSVTENVTITPGVNIASFSSDTLNTPTIIGKITMTGAGTSTITNVKLQTNSDFCVVVSGSSASILNLDQCYIKAANNTAISFTSSSSSAEINLSYCKGSLDTTGIAYFAHSSAGATRLRHCNMTNPGSSVTASTFSAGTLDITWTQFSNPITSSSTASMGGYFSNFQFSSLNVTALTAGGSGNHEFRFCSFISDTASAVSISSSCNLYDCVVYSTNTNAITGAGTLNYSNLIFSGSSQKINTTTQVGGLAKGGQTQAPSAGFVGEQISSYISSGSALSLSSGTAKTITSIDLTAGIWDITLLCSVANTGSTQAQLASISTTTNTLSGSNGLSQGGWSGGVTTPNFIIAVPTYRVVITTTTTYYLVAQSTFTTGTASSYGRITGTRVG